MSKSTLEPEFEQRPIFDTVPIDERYAIVPGFEFLGEIFDPCCALVYGGSAAQRQSFAGKLMQALPRPAEAIWVKNGEHRFVRKRRRSQITPVFMYMGKGNPSPHLAIEMDIMVKIEDGVATTTKNRFGPVGSTMPMTKICEGLGHD